MEMCNNDRQSEVDVFLLANKAAVAESTKAMELCNHKGMECLWQDRHEWKRRMVVRVIGKVVGSEECSFIVMGSWKIEDKLWQVRNARRILKHLIDVIDDPALFVQLAPLLRN